VQTLKVVETYFASLRKQIEDPTMTAVIRRRRNCICQLP